MKNQARETSPQPPLDEAAVSAESASADPEGSPPSSDQAENDTGRTGTREEVGDLLTELARTLQKYSMYPANHPSLDGAAEALTARLSEIVEDRAELTISIGRTQIFIDEAATNPDNAVMRGLAIHLRRHQVASITLRSGIDSEEVASFLATFAVDPNLEADDSEATRETAALWSNIDIRFVEYDRLELDDGSLESADANEPDIWLTLADSAMNQTANGTHETADAPTMARTIAANCADTDYSSEVAGRLLEVSRTADASAASRGQLRSLTSDLVTELEPETLRSLLENGTDRNERQELLANSSRFLRASAVVKLLRETATLDEYGLPHALTMMLTKLARYADHGPRDKRQQADALLRDQMDALLEAHEDANSTPSDYAGILEEMSMNRVSRQPKPPLGAQVTVEPERLVQMGLEVDQVEGLVSQALDEMVETGLVARALDLLDTASAQEAADQLREKIKGSGVLETLLAREALDLTTIDRLVSLLGEAAIDPLLETLADSESHAVRTRLFKHLAGLGASVGPQAVSRLEDERWYVRRNMLSLLAELEAVPPGFSAVAYLDDENEAVRLAAIKLLLREPDEKARAVGEALSSGDKHTTSLGLAAAREELPVEHLPAVISIALDARNPRAIRREAVQALGASQDRSALEALLKLAQGKRGLRRSKRAASATLLVEALTVLSSQWSDDSRAAKVLARAQRSENPKIRRAARTKGSRR